MTGRRFAQRTLLMLVLAVVVRADDRVANSKHDLSATGPGPTRALNEDQICIFCHTPHNASPVAPLWNRYSPTSYYRIYRSPTMQARVDQPGPASKLCLSCHDGTVALGLVLDRPFTDPIPMTHPYITGPADLTTDLSDDHPIGFRYDQQLSNADPQIREPGLVDFRIKLGARGELECTACHDPHNNELGNFLRITDREGALCRTCHDMRGWELSAHAITSRNVPLTVTQGVRLPYNSLAENACLSCHVSHNAPWREQLLRDRPSRLCLDCHNGVSAVDIAPVVDQLSGHRMNPLWESRARGELGYRVSPFTECTACHNPHAVAVAVPGPTLSVALNTPFVPPAMRDMPGINLAGLPVPTATWYYEVCFLCHSDFPVLARDRIVRQVDTLGNVRREFLPTAASAHPVVFPSRRSTEVPSLEPQWRSRVFISCQNCHNNPNAIDAGGTQVSGPHTSRYKPLLVAQYETRDFTMDSPQAYALCYMCHDRASILGDESFSLHRVHVVNGRSPCSACHTAHGVSGSPTHHAHLINFDILIVGGQRYYADTGRFSGTCTLICHGVQHVNFTYGP
jgi:predicted CXXCH cytochrome family protein